MVEKLFRTSDGKTYKTEKSAIEHEAKIKLDVIAHELGMKNRDELMDKMRELADKGHQKLKLLLNTPLVKWEKNGLIDQIPSELKWTPPEKKVKVAIEYIFGVRNTVFIDVPESAIKNGWSKTVAEFANIDFSKFEQYGDMKTENIQENWYSKAEERLVIRLRDKGIDSKEEFYKNAIDNGIKLSHEELDDLVFSTYSVAKNEGEDHRWTREVQTIIELCGELYAIDWDRGLTENQENMFDEQPYKVVKQEREVKTIVTEYIPA